MTRKPARAPLIIGTVLAALTLVSTGWVFVAQMAEAEFRQGRLHIAQMAMQLFADLVAWSMVFIFVYLIGEALLRLVKSVLRATAAVRQSASSNDKSGKP